MDSIKQTEIANFLGMSLPPDLILPDTINGVKFFERTDIEKILLERLPFYFIEKAVSIGRNDKMVVLTKSTITVERCEGHFPPPLRTIAPFIEFFKACAQSGILLGGLMVPGHVPVANGEGHFKSYNKNFIFAPVDILVEAKMPGSWLEYNIKMLGDTKVYAAGKAVAQLWTEYIFIGKKVFERIARNKSVA